ncbi:MAG: universal stress protein [Deltaproteobacteria bacterium]|nr:universal stress protein [Deltaproteobacteria bacterium]
MDYQKILLAYSDPKKDVKLLEAALDIAHRYGAPLTLIHLNVQTGAHIAHGYVGFQHMYNEQEIEEQLKNLNKQDVKTEIKIVKARSIDVVETIVRESKPYDLLITGHNHMNFLEAHITHSTDEKVINQINTHTLVIPV